MQRTKFIDPTGRRRYSELDGDALVSGGQTYVLDVLKPPNAVDAHGEEVSILAGKEQVEYEAERGAYIAPSGPLPDEFGR